jgi:hypothetical protein
MTQDVPEIFLGTVEVDETYLGGQWKNKRKMIRDKGPKRGRGNTCGDTIINLIQKG